VKNGARLGLHHLGGVSETVDRSVRVYNEQGTLVRVIGEHRGEPLDIQFIKPDKPTGFQKEKINHDNFFLDP
jgi:hypothetical protein